MRYRVFATDAYLDALDGFPKADKAFLEKKVVGYVAPQLKQEPHFGANIKKLRGYEPDTWRYRIGDIRLFYEIDEGEKIVSLVAVERRKDAY